MKNTVPAQPVRVVLADDHDLVRSGIKALLGMIEGDPKVLKSVPAGSPVRVERSEEPG